MSLAVRSHKLLTAFLTALAFRLYLSSKLDYFVLQLPVIKYIARRMQHIKIISVVRC